MQGSNRGNDPERKNTDLQNFKEEEALILRSRMRPFKTKLKFDHKIEWGMSKEVAEYPVVKLKPVSIFDLKGFDKKKREEKINNMLGNSGSDKPFGNPFGGPMGGNPFGGSMMGNPFGGSMGGNPFAQKNPFENKSNDSFNVDDLVKRIDAKIAELEKEEQEENERNNKELSDNKSSNDSKLEIRDDNVVDAVIDDEDNKSSVDDITSKNDITDDQFFDDFFSDE